MTIYARILGMLFGAMMLLLALLITVETVIRKAFSMSLGGVDELGGYAIAIAAPLAFCVAMVEQSHIRINLVHMRLPFRVQAVLNALAAAVLTAQAMGLLAKGDWKALNRRFGPSSTQDELAAELEDLKQREQQSDEPLLDEPQADESPTGDPARKGGQS